MASRKAATPVLRIVVCAQCGEKVEIHKRHDWRRRYCSVRCRDLRTKELARERTRRFQQTSRGADRNRARQQRFREKRRAAQVTHDDAEEGSSPTSPGRITDFSELERVVRAHGIRGHHVEETLSDVAIALVQREQAAPDNPKGSKMSYALGVARNKCTDVLRSLAKQRRRTTPLDEFDLSDVESEGSEGMARGELIEMVFDLDRSLRSNRQREVLQLHFLHGVGVHQIAELTNRWPSHVRRDVEAVLRRVWKESSSWSARRL